MAIVLLSILDINSQKNQQSHDKDVLSKKAVAAIKLLPASVGNAANLVCKEINRKSLECRTDLISNSYLFEGYPTEMSAAGWRRVENSSSWGKTVIPEGWSFILNIYYYPKRKEFVIRINLTG